MNNMTIQAAAKPTNILCFQAPAVLDVEAKAEDGTPKRPSFTINAYSGATMNVAGFYSPIVVDLAGLKAGTQQIPILLDHDTSQIIGQTDAIAIDAAGVRLTGSITGEDKHSTKVVTHAKNGFQWQASIGANIIRQEFLKAGEKAVVNGRDVSGPLVIARESRLFETSFVAIGADSQTSASVAASLSFGSHTGASSMFEQWLQAKGIDPASLADSVRVALQASYDAEQALKAKVETPPAPQPKAAITQNLDDIIKAQRDEDARVQQITTITAEAIHNRPVMIDEFERLSRQAIEAKSSVGDFELAMLRVRANTAPGAYVRSASGSDLRTTGKVIEAALCRSGRLDDYEKNFDDKTLQLANDRFRHGLGLQELLLMVAHENGYRGHSATDVHGVLRAAFPHDTIRAEGFSTLSLPGILGNVANKFLVAGFNAVEAGWRDITTIRNVRDFKQVTSYSLSGDMTYEQVGPGGELKHATVGETSYTNQAATYGRMFAITRTDIINDDLGALTQVPQRLGRGAALKLNDVFWTAWLAGVGVTWTSGHANLLTGGTSTLTSAGLTLGLAKFRKQTDPDSKPLGISPKILLVPPELEIAADELMTSTYVNTGGSSTTDKVPNANMWRSKFKTVTSSYLSNSSYTGYSTTAWWLLADPMDLSSVEVAFLNGRETPIVEQADADFSTLGIQMRGYHDFGVGMQEYRAGMRSAGA